MPTQYAEQCWMLGKDARKGGVEKCREKEEAAWNHVQLQEAEEEDRRTRG